MKVKIAGKTIKVDYVKLLNPFFNFLLYETYNYVILYKLPWSNVDFLANSTDKNFPANYIAWAVLLMLSMIPLYISSLAVYFLSILIARIFFNSKMGAVNKVFVVFFYILLFPMEYMIVHFTVLYISGINELLHVNTTILTALIFLLISWVQNKVHIGEMDETTSAWGRACNKTLNLFLATFIVFFSLFFILTLLFSVVEAF